MSERKSTSPPANPVTCDLGVPPAIYGQDKSPATGIGEGLGSQKPPQTNLTRPPAPGASGGSAAQGNSGGKKN